MDGEAIFWLDIDEVRNRLYLGVAHEQARSVARATAAARGIPSAALEIGIEPRPEYRATTLVDYWRPVAGGLKLSRPIDPPLVAICTLGFNASVNGAPHFLTASHCSAEQFRLDNSEQYQPGLAYPRIGQEAFDTWLWPCNFPNPGLGCRLSDASIYAYDAAVSYEAGRIMKTGWAGENQRGSLQIDEGFGPYFDVQAKWNRTTDAPVGTLLHKVGQTSGWTKGTVTRTCVYFSFARLRCQWESTVWSERGDSGSPLFHLLSGIGGPWVALHGILWGGPDGDWNTTWHSPLSGIERDFQELTLSVCMPAYGC